MSANPFREDRDKYIALLVEAIKDILPEGARFSVEGVPLQYCVDITCSGEDRIMGYSCALAPEHTGSCYSMTKHIHFARKVYSASDIKSSTGGVKSIL